MHAKADMMILVILSHGRDGKIITSSGREYQIESIYEKFNNRECPFLKGKPKFFIIQVIRTLNIISEKVLRLTNRDYV